MLPALSFALLIAAPQGDVFVADAGLLVISGTAVRLSGIALPAEGTPARDVAREAVEGLVAGQMVTCRLGAQGLFSYREGTCAAGGADIGEALIERGLAWPCPALVARAGEEAAACISP